MAKQKQPAEAKYKYTLELEIRAHINMSRAELIERVTEALQSEPVFETISVDDVSFDGPEAQRPA